MSEPNVGDGVVAADDVTRHSGLIEYLRSEGIAPEGREVVEHATADLVRGRHVIGVLPLWLAAEAATVTEIPMSIPPELRGEELTAEQTAEHAGEPVTYQVTVLDGCRQCGCPKGETHRRLGSLTGGASPPAPPPPQPAVPRR